MIHTNWPPFLSLSWGRGPGVEGGVSQKTVAVWRTLLQIRITHPGEMAEWFKAHAWKACVGKIYRGFESLSLRQFDFCELSHFRGLVMRTRLQIILDNTLSLT